MAASFHIDRLLLATDLSPVSEAAFRCAAAVAERFQARLYVLHVVAEAASGAQAAEEGAAQQRAAERRALGELRRWQETVSVDDDDCVMAVLAGEPAIRIVQKAQQLDVDLIVLGAHDRSKGPAIHDVVQEVCTASPCPVMCVPPGREPNIEGERHR